MILIKGSTSRKRIIDKNFSVTNILTENSFKKLSFALGHARKEVKTTKNLKSTRIYYVLNGRMFVKSKKKTLTANKGDLILIPKNTLYTISGTFDAVLINFPAFNPKYERTL